VLKTAQNKRTDEEAFVDDIAGRVVDSLDALRIAVTLFDSSERLIYANRHFNYLFKAMPDRSRLVGLSYESLVWLEVTRGVVARPQDAEAFVESRRLQLREGEFVPRDVQLADGRIVEIKARRAPRGGWIVLWTDATESRRLMGRLESAIELSTDAFAFYDHADRLVVCNTGFAHLHGHAGPLDFVGRSSKDIMEEAARRGQFKVDGDLDDWLERRREAHESPAGVVTLTANKSSYLVRERATADGRVTVFTDVTDARRVEAALSEQMSALERAQRALDESKSEARRQATYLSDLSERLGKAEADADETKKTLLRTMSHELKTPLNAIIGFSDLIGSMADRFDPEQIREYAGLIHQGGHNLLRLLNQILDLTRLAAGKYDLQRTAVDCAEVLMNAKSQLEDAAAAKSIQVQLDVPSRATLVMADEAVLGGMVQQLLTNAVNFTQPGGEVAMSIARNGAFVILEVADNGPGVAQEDIERILRPFEQVGRSAADHTAGAGLGLTLVQALADLHGGRLNIASSAGLGFTARLALPAS
jgi:signal transduction histidine kinase